jgi:hypothetical protein
MHGQAQDAAGRPQPAPPLAAIITALLLCLHGCVPGAGMRHETRATERTDLEITKSGAPLVRSIYCDILVQPVDDGLWRKLAMSSAYSSKWKPGLSRRVPPLTAFMVIVTNTVNAPILLEKTELRYGGAVLAELSPAAIGARFRSAAFSIYDFKRLLSFRRIVTGRYAASRVDYDRDTIEEKIDFIPPRDSVIRLVAFEKIPVEARSFRLNFMISAMGTSKQIDFDFTRHEYREGEKGYAIEKKEKDEADDDE